MGMFLQEHWSGQAEAEPCLSNSSSHRAAPTPRYTILNDRSCNKEDLNDRACNKEEQAVGWPSSNR